MVTTNDDELAKRIRADVINYDFLNKRQILKKLLEVIMMKMFTYHLTFSLFLFPLIYFFSRFGIDIIHNIFSEKVTLQVCLSKNDFKLIPITETGLMELMHLDSLNDERIRNVTYLLNHLRELDGVIFPSLSDKVKNIFSNFPIRTKNRNILAKELLKKG